MPIAHDATSTAEGSAVSSLSWSHTVAGTDRIVMGAAGLSETTDANRDVTGMTYAAASLTEVGVRDDTTNNIKTEMWRRLAPATGANTMEITFAGVVTSAAGAASSYTGVDQTTPLGTWASANGTGDPATVDVTSATDELVIDTVVALDTAITVGADQTSRWNNPFAAPAEVASHAGSTEPGAATITMSWTGIDVGLAWVIGGVSMKPVAAAIGAAEFMASARLAAMTAGVTGRIYV